MGTGIPYPTIVDKHLDCAIMALQSILSAPSSKSCWISWLVSIYTLWFLTSILLQAQEHLLYSCRALSPKARAQWILRLAFQCPNPYGSSFTSQLLIQKGSIETYQEGFAYLTLIMKGHYTDRWNTGKEF